MIFRQLYDSVSGTYSYLLASRRGGEVQTESTAGLGNDQLARRIPAPPICAMTCPPHEVSYSTMEKLQYGGSQAQESEQPASTCSVHVYPMRPHLSANLCSALTFAAVAVASSVMLTADHAAIQYRVVPPGEAAHFVSADCRLDDE